MKKLIALGGSSSTKSINKQLARYAAELVQGVERITLDLNDYDLPLFSVDKEAEDGFPKDLLVLNDKLMEADGFVISLAEHNGAYSAAFKNAFDWLSRVEGKVWRNKPMLLLSTSPGARGGQSVLELAETRFPYNGGNIIGAMSFPSFDENFKDGNIVHAELKNKLMTLCDELRQSL